MGCGTSFVKYVLFFFNLLAALLGLAIIGIGVAVLLNWTFLKNELQSNITVAPWVFIVIGAITFVIAFFGCCGAIRESHCMVVTYAIFLLVIIIVQVVLAVLLFTYEDNLRSGVVSSVGALYKKRSSNSVDQVTEDVINNLQQQFSCCGAQGYGYYGFGSALNLPQSCCPRDAGVCTAVNAYKGCEIRIGELYDHWNKPIAGTAIGVACVEVIGALFALCLANSIRNMDRRSRY